MLRWRSFLLSLIFSYDFPPFLPLLDLEWRVIWVGSAEDSTQDQILEEVLVGPVSVGVNRFELETPPPNASKIPLEDLKGVTVMLITCSYRDTEFVRVGYYVSCEMPGDNQVGPNGEQLPGLTPDPHQMVRNILADKPRITKVCAFSADSCIVLIFLAKRLYCTPMLLLSCILIHSPLVSHHMGK